MANQYVALTDVRDMKLELYRQIDLRNSCAIMLFM